MRTIVASLLSLLVAGAGNAADWPQWLGPTRNGVSTESVKPWNGELQVLWRQSLGEGHSSPVVAGGNVYVHAKVAGKDEEELIAFDFHTGKEVWRRSYPRASFTSVFGDGPRATPAVVDGRIYALGVTGVLSCQDAGDGKPLWSIDTLKDCNAPNLKFGVSASPLVDGDNVIVCPGGKGASIVAYRRSDGKGVWRSLDDPASYSSPIIVSRGDQRQLICVTQQGVVSLDPQAGKLRWRSPMVDLLNESSTTPVNLGDMVLAGSVTFGSVGLRLQQQPPGMTRVWKNPLLTCYFSTPVPAAKQSVYMVTGTIIPPPQATLRCVDVQTGKELWHKEKIGKYHASMIRTANDKILLLEDSGGLALVEPSDKEYRELCRCNVCGQAWAHPALADGCLVVRDDKEVICLKLP